MDLILRNLRLREGETTVLTDLGIAGGCIAAVAPGLGAEAPETEELDLGGRMVLAGRRFTRLDYGRLRRDVEAAVQRLKEANAPTRTRMEAMAAYVSRYCVGLACAGYHVRRRLDGAGQMRAAPEG